MIAELISRIVIAHELTPDEPRLLDVFFESFAGEWEFLRDYFAQFRSLPNAATFCGQFPDFPFEQTERTAQWLLDEVETTHVDLMLNKCLIDFHDKKAVNPKAAALYLETILQTVRPLVSTALGAPLTLLVDDAAEECDLIERSLHIGLAGVPSGFAMLDEITQGTAPGELEIWFGRPGEGKTLMLLIGTLAACASGYDTVFISPEMNEREIRARLYAMQLHVSASAVQFGKLTPFEFESFMADRKHFFDTHSDWGRLLFREAQGRSGRFTTADLRRVIEIDKPGLLTIDGLMLIDPIAVEHDPRKRLVALNSELKQLAVESKVPIRIAHQANRASDVSSRKSRNVTLNDVMPDLSHLSESASVEHYANRVVAVKRLGSRTYLALRKNRSAENGRMMSFEYEIDHGHISDVKREYGDTLLDSINRNPSKEASAAVNPF